MKRIALSLMMLALSACHSEQSKQKDEKKAAPESGKQEAGVVTLGGEEQRRGGIAVESVVYVEQPDSVTAPGQLTENEDRTWHIGAVVDGIVHEVLAKQGDLVRRGQPLSRIHSHEVHETRAAYSEALIELNRARAGVAYARERRDRARRLLDLKAGSRQDLEAAEGDLTNAQAQVSKAEAEVHKEKIHLTDVLHVAPDDEPGHTGSEDDVPIFTPAAGTIMDRKVSVGSVISTGEEMFSVTDTSTLWMIAAVNEADLGKLHPGQHVRISVRAFPGHEFSGRVLKLGEKLDPSTRTLQVRILVPNPGNQLKPGMFATASLEQANQSKALFVPDAAVQDINGISAVFIRSDGDHFRARTVKIGRRVNGQSEILEGLRSGEDVAVKGAFLLKSQLMKSALEEE